MNYINEGKRDILLFPKFENIDKIQEIRKQYDELASILPPHITLAFPFVSDLSQEELESKLKTILDGHSKFEVECSNISFVYDERINKYFIFLNISKGYDEIIKLHNSIYDNLLCVDRPSNYVPHITLGTVDSTDIDVKLADKFSTTIDEAIVERIGDNESSIIESKIKIK